LSWYYAGDGYAQVYGDHENLVAGDTALSTSDAESGTGVVSPGDSASSSGRAYGEVDEDSGGMGMHN